MKPPTRPGQGKIPEFSLDRHVAQAPTPADTPGAGENRISITTFFTQVVPVGSPAQLIYNADRMWAKVTLTLRTAGPVAVGQLDQLGPVGSGKGQELQTDVPLSFTIAKGNPLYVVASSVNSISVVIEPYPWLETITGLTTGMVRPAQAAVAAPPVARTGMFVPPSRPSKL